MADRSEPKPSLRPRRPLADQAVDAALDELTQVLLSIASARFDVRAGRSYTGDPLDVLAFLVNSTADEVSQLLEQLRREQRLLQEARDRLAQSEKAAALGALAGGVAHELNQPLTAIKTLVELMLAKPEASVAECASDLELVGRAARRMSKIVGGIRAFASGDDSVEQRRIRAAEPLIDAAGLLGETLKSRGLDVSLRVSGSIPDVLADPDRLQQVFINLIHNAADALEDLPPERTRAIELSVAAAEGWVIYAVDDSGEGVPDAIRPQIFDPFFTTKAVDRGTGLGLSISHGIVREHGGTLQYEPSSLGGARFVVRLPSLAEDVPDAAP